MACWEHTVNQRIPEIGLRMEMGGAARRRAASDSHTTNDAGNLRVGDWIGGNARTYAGVSHCVIRCNIGRSANVYCCRGLLPAGVAYGLLGSEDSCKWGGSA